MSPLKIFSKVKHGARPVKAECACSASLGVLHDGGRLSYNYTDKKNSHRN